MQIEENTVQTSDKDQHGGEGNGSSNKDSNSTNGDHSSFSSHNDLSKNSEKGSDNNNKDQPASVKAQASSDKTDESTVTLRESQSLGDEQEDKSQKTDNLMAKVTTTIDTQEPISTSAIKHHGDNGNHIKEETGKHQLPSHQIPEHKTPNDEQKSAQSLVETPTEDGGDEQIQDFDDIEIALKEREGEEEEEISEIFDEEEELSEGESLEELEDEVEGDGEGRKQRDKPSYSSRRKLKFEDEIDQGEDSLGEDNTSTYTEMIEQALRALGGRGTGVEITSYIDENYSQVLSNKTKTWRNSVMGCLSANRRNLFAKEPVKENAKRYVWKLNDSPTPEQTDKKPAAIKKRKLAGEGEEESNPEIKLDAPKIKDKEKDKDKDKDNRDISTPKDKESPKVPTQSSSPSVDDMKGKRKHEKTEDKTKKDKEKEKEIDNNKNKKTPNSPPTTLSASTVIASSPSQPASISTIMYSSQQASTSIPTTASSTPTSSASVVVLDANTSTVNEEGIDFVSLIETAIKSMGGKATGADITDWIASQHKELSSNKKKLTYTVNAILSSKKYNNLFIKDQMVNNGSRALWKLGPKAKLPAKQSSKLLTAN